MSFALINGGITAPRGYKASGVRCGIKKSGLDLSVIKSETPAVCAGVFTQNVVKAAPVVWCQKVVGKGEADVVVVNSGNANACNGAQGLADAERTAELAGTACNVAAERVLVASTGVIGVPLDMGKISAGISAAVGELAIAGSAAAAQAIMTTDTYPKEQALEVNLSGGVVRIGGMTKGSGMIHPNMATMLGFITTDAEVDQSFLQQALSSVVDKSFNMISVDGDTSTNDMVLMLANGASKVAVTTEADKEAFSQALQVLAVDLAKRIARDGEGATKLVEVRVQGSPSMAEASHIARTISRSNLVKTAIFGEDANWGRIFCAAGYSGINFDPSKVDIFLGDLQVAKAGGSIRFDEARAKALLGKTEVAIIVDLHSGEAVATAWTCDLSYDYIRINADYRT